MKTAIELITEERHRQIDKEGWSKEHDDSHTDGELLRAGLAYVQHAHGKHHPPKGFLWAQDHGWPWDIPSWKPSTPYRDFIKGGALIQAELDRLLRLPNHFGKTKAALLDCEAWLNRLMTEPPADVCPQK